MSSTSGSSSSSSSSSSGGGSGGSSYNYYNPDTNKFEKRYVGGSAGTVSTNTGGTVSLPTPAYEAPRGASLGQSTSTGGSLVSTGYGTAVDTSNNQHVLASTTPNAYTTPVPTSAPFTQGSDGLPTAKTSTNLGGGSSSGSGGGGGPVGTTVNQKPTEASPGKDTGGGTQSGPRTDSSVVLAGQINRRPDRSPARSNNFVSMIGGAGGLGRRSGDAKRTLIGGA